MSIGGPSGSASASLDAAVTAGIKKGVHFTVAAGNGSQPASETSPADVAAANTIGAVDSDNVVASFSNYGPDVDVWAPGVNILSAWIGSPSASKRLDGTSMATYVFLSLPSFFIIFPASSSDPGLVTQSFRRWHSRRRIERARLRHPYRSEC